MYINPNNALIQDPVAASALRVMVNTGKRERVNKGALILIEGQACDFLFFVVSGAFRAFRWVEDKEVTIGFTFCSDVDTCPYAFFNGLPSLDIIEALSDGVIIRIKKSDIDKLILEKPELKEFLTLLLSHNPEHGFVVAFQINTYFGFDGDPIEIFDEIKWRLAASLPAYRAANQ